MSLKFLQLPPELHFQIFAGLTSQNIRASNPLPAQILTPPLTLLYTLWSCHPTPGSRFHDTLLLYTKLTHRLFRDRLITLLLNFENAEYPQQADVLRAFLICTMNNIIDIFIKLSPDDEAFEAWFWEGFWPVWDGIVPPRNSKGRILSGWSRSRWSPVGSEEMELVKRDRVSERLEMVCAAKGRARLLEMLVKRRLEREGIVAEDDVKKEVELGFEYDCWGSRIRAPRDDWVC
jgi:hypothetical protein